MQNAEDNNNSGRDFLSDVNLFRASPHAIMYPEIMTNFTLEDITLWKIYKKQVLTWQLDIVKIETDIAYINTLLQASLQSISIIKALEPILINSTFPNSSPLQLLDVAANANCKPITDYINAILPLNILQRLVIEENFDHVI